MKKTQETLDEIHQSVADIDSRFSHLMVDVETIVQTNQTLESTIAQQSQQLESQSLQIQALSLQLQIQNDKLRQNTQTLDKMLALVTEMSKQTASENESKRKRVIYSEKPQFSGGYFEAQGTLDRARTIIALYVSEDLSKACMQLMRHIANTVAYLCKTEENLQAVATDRNSRRMLKFNIVATWGEHPLETRETLIHCMREVFRILPFTMSPIDLQSAAACFSEVTVSNRRSQECRLYDKLCVTYKDSTPDKWPPAANPPRYADIAFLDDSGNVVLRRKPNKEIHSTYITLVGAVPDYDKDEIIRVAKEKVKEHVDIFATAYNEEQENPPAQDPDPEPVTPLEINQMVDSVMDHVMSSVLNTHVDTGEGNGESMGDGGGSDQEMS